MLQNICRNCFKRSCKCCDTDSSKQSNEQSEHSNTAFKKRDSSEENAISISKLDLPSRISKEAIPAPGAVQGMSITEIHDIANEVENIYGLALSLMRNYVGKPSYPFITPPKQLFPYIVSLCDGLDQEIMHAKYPRRKLKDMQLTVIIKEAKLTLPTDTEFRNMYCKIMIDDSDIEHKTYTQDSGNFLVWEEGFICPLDNYPDEVLRIEMWGEIPDEVVRYAESPDGYVLQPREKFLVGDIIRPIKELPCYVDAVFWPLQRVAGKSFTRGELKLYIRVAANPDKDHFYYVYMYMQIIMLAYKHNLDFLKYSTIWKTWLEILPNPALTLLQQLALQHGITLNEQCICSWIAAADLRMKGETRVSYYLLHTLLKGLILDIGNYPLEDYLKNALINSTAKFAIYMLDELANIHDAFRIEMSVMADEMYYLLKCMNCADIQNHTNYIDSFPVIQSEARHWFMRVIKEKAPELVANNIITIIDALIYIIKTYYKNQVIMDDIFERAWTITYTKITYEVLDKIIANIIKPIIEHVTKIVSADGREFQLEQTVKMLQLYHSMKNLVSYTEKDLPAYQNKLAMDGYCSWFNEDLILEWFLICTLYTGPYIHRAIKLDPMQCLDLDILHGSSVPDVAKIVDELVVDVWMRLDWKNQYYTHGPLTVAIRSCVNQYVEDMYKKIVDQNFFCAAESFEVSTKLCVGLSSAFVILEYLHKIKEKITSVLSRAAAEHSHEIADPLFDIDSEWQVGVSSLFHEVCDVIDKRFRELTKQIFRSKKNPEEVRAANTCCAFVESSLGMLHQNLKPELFYIMLRQLWIAVVLHYKDIADNKPLIFDRRSKRKDDHSVLISETLNKLYNIFYSDGNGLSRVELEYKVYRNLSKKIMAVNKATI